MADSPEHDQRSGIPNSPESAECAPSSPFEVPVRKPLTGSSADFAGPFGYQEPSEGRGDAAKLNHDPGLSSPSLSETDDDVYRPLTLVKCHTDLLKLTHEATEEDLNICDPNSDGSSDGNMNTTKTSTNFSLQQEANAFDDPLNEVAKSVIESAIENNSTAHPELGDSGNLTPETLNKNEEFSNIGEFKSIDSDEAPDLSSANNNSEFEDREDDGEISMAENNEECYGEDVFEGGEGETSSSTEAIKVSTIVEKENHWSMVADTHTTASQLTSDGVSVPLITLTTPDGLVELVTSPKSHSVTTKSTIPHAVMENLVGHSMNLSLENQNTTLGQESLAKDDTLNSSSISTSKGGNEGLVNTVCRDPKQNTESSVISNNDLGLKDDSDKCSLYGRPSTVSLQINSSDLSVDCSAILSSSNKAPFAEANIHHNEDMHAASSLDESNIVDMPILEEQTCLLLCHNDDILSNRVSDDIVNAYGEHTTMKPFMEKLLLEGNEMLSSNSEVVSEPIQIQAKYEHHAPDDTSMSNFSHLQLAADGCEGSIGRIDMEASNKNEKDWVHSEPCPNSATNTENKASDSHQGISDGCEKSPPQLITIENTKFLDSINVHASNMKNEVCDKSDPELDDKDEIPPSMIIHDDDEEKSVKPFNLAYFVKIREDAKIEMANNTRNIPDNEKETCGEMRITESGSGKKDHLTDWRIFDIENENNIRQLETNQKSPTGAEDQDSNLQLINGYGKQEFADATFTGSAVGNVEGNFKEFCQDSAAKSEDNDDPCSPEIDGKEISEDMDVIRADCDDNCVESEGDCSATNNDDKKVSSRLNVTSPVANCDEESEKQIACDPGNILGYTSNAAENDLGVTKLSSDHDDGHINGLYFDAEKEIGRVEEFLNQSTAKLEEKDSHSHLIDKNGNDIRQLEAHQKSPTESEDENQLIPRNAENKVSDSSCHALGNNDEEVSSDVNITKPESDVNQGDIYHDDSISQGFETNQGNLIEISCPKVDNGNAIANITTLEMCGDVDQLKLHQEDTARSEDEEQPSPGNVEKEITAGSNHTVGDDAEIPGDVNSAEPESDVNQVDDICQSRSIDQSFDISHDDVISQIDLMSQGLEIKESDSIKGPHCEFNIENACAAATTADRSGKNQQKSTSSSEREEEQLIFENIENKVVTNLHRALGNDGEKVSENMNTSESESNINQGHIINQGNFVNKGNSITQCEPINQDICQSRSPDQSPEINYDDAISQVDSMSQELEIKGSDPIKVPPSDIDTGNASVTTTTVDMRGEIQQESASRSESEEERLISEKFENEVVDNLHRALGDDGEKVSENMNTSEPNITLGHLIKQKHSANQGDFIIQSEPINQDICQSRSADHSPNISHDDVICQVDSMSQGLEIRESDLIKVPPSDIDTGKASVTATTVNMNGEIQQESASISEGEEQRIPGSVENEIATNLLHALCDDGKEVSENMNTSDSKPNINQGHPINQGDSANQDDSITQSEPINQNINQENLTRVQCSSADNKEAVNNTNVTASVILRNIQPLELHQEGTARPEHDLERHIADSHIVVGDDDKELSSDMSSTKPKSINIDQVDSIDQSNPIKKDVTAHQDDHIDNDHSIDVTHFNANIPGAQLEPNPINVDQGDSIDQSDPIKNYAVVNQGDITNCGHAIEVPCSNTNDPEAQLGGLCSPIINEIESEESASPGKISADVIDVGQADISSGDIQHLSECAPRLEDINDTSGESDGIDDEDFLLAEAESAFFAEFGDDLSPSNGNALNKDALTSEEKQNNASEILTSDSKDCEASGEHADFKRSPSATISCDPEESYPVARGNNEVEYQEEPPLSSIRGSNPQNDKNSAGLAETDSYSEGSSIENSLKESSIQTVICPTITPLSSQPADSLIEEAMERDLKTETSNTPAPMMSARVKDGFTSNDLYFVSPTISATNLNLSDKLLKIRQMPTRTDGDSPVRSKSKPITADWVSAKPFQPRVQKSLFGGPFYHVEQLCQGGGAQYFNNNNCHNRSQKKHIMRGNADSRHEYGDHSDVLEQSGEDNSQDEVLDIIVLPDQQDRQPEIPRSSLSSRINPNAPQFRPPSVPHTYSYAPHTMSRPPHPPAHRFAPPPHHPGSQSSADFHRPPAPAYIPHSNIRPSFNQPKPPRYPPMSGPPMGGANIFTPRVPMAPPHRPPHHVPVNHFNPPYPGPYTGPYTPPSSDPLNPPKVCTVRDSVVPYQEIDGCCYFDPTYMPDRPPPDVQYGYSQRGKRRKYDRLSSRFSTQAGKLNHHVNFYVISCAEAAKGEAAYEGYNDM